MTFRLEYVLPFIVGFSTVIQAGLNKRISDAWGLSWALFFNSVVLLIILGICMLFGLWPGRPSMESFRWWYCIPAFTGFAIIAGMPLAIMKVGALNSFLIVIGAQILFSILWDKGFEGIAISWTRLLGAAIVFIGAYVAIR